MIEIKVPDIGDAKVGSNVDESNVMSPISYHQSTFSPMTNFGGNNSPGLDLIQT